MDINFDLIDKISLSIKFPIFGMSPWNVLFMIFPCLWYFPFKVWWVGCGADENKTEREEYIKTSEQEGNSAP